MKNSDANLPAMLLLAGLLTAGTASAQSPNPGGPRHDGLRHGGPPTAEQQLARLSEQLQLTDQQSLDVLEVLLARQQEQEALRARMIEAMRPEICTLIQNTEADVLAILTPEQGEQFRQINAERRDRAKGRRGSALPDCEDSPG